MSFIPLQKSDRIFVAGHRGLIGSSLLSGLGTRDYRSLLTEDRSQLDLRDAAAVDAWFSRSRPDVVFLAAARVGGIVANNQFRSEFLIDNLQVQNSVIMAAHRYDCRLLVFLGSSCAYPRNCPQPIKETYLLTQSLEFTNRPYAIAKIAGLELINSLNIQFDRRYFSVTPTNLYGPNDHFDLETSHVLPALVRRIHLAKIQSLDCVEVWGSGTPLREFMYAPDCADAIIHLAENLDESFFRSQFASPEKFFHINVGSGQEVSIKALAEMVADIVNYRGRIVFDHSKPDGTPRKLLDSSFLKSMNWQATTQLQTGIQKTYEWLKRQELK